MSTIEHEGKTERGGVLWIAFPSREWEKLKKRILKEYKSAKATN